MKEITAAELHRKIKSGEKLTLVDVREEFEHEEFNIGGINIPLGEIPSHPEKIRALGDGDIVLYCRSGNRSGMAQKLLAVQHDIHNTINLKGGVIAWGNEVSE